jgi:ribosomal protein S18 acetylase RimI-like enzyme
VRRASFAQAAVEQGAAALNRVFERYLVPITFSSEQLHLHMSYNDVDEAASPIWYDDEGNVLAAALLAVRGKRGWIGGFGVAPEYRGHGIGAQLVETLKTTARERGLESIQREALTENLPAINVYLNAGFKIARILRSFERVLDGIEKPPQVVTSRPEDFIDRPDPAQPCWQRERRTLRNGAVSTAASDMHGNYALFRYNAHAAQILKIGTSDAENLDGLAHAIAAGREFQSVLLLNEPDASPITEYAKAAGWTQPFTQYEMRLEIY